jgi:hypothetical protein
LGITISILSVSFSPPHYDSAATVFYAQNFLSRLSASSAFFSRLAFNFTSSQSNNESRGVDDRLSPAASFAAFLLGGKKQKGDESGYVSIIRLGVLFWYAIHH